jgi:hypothetical protein
MASLVLLFLADYSVLAQPPEARERAGRNAAKSAGVEGFVNRLMELDADKDGQLSRDEVKDSRLQSLFDRADADKDGSVTKTELQELYKKEAPKGTMNLRNANRPGPGKGRPDNGAGPPRGARGGRQQFGPPQPGQVLPKFLQDALELSDEQRKQIDDLQKDVDERLGKILTDEQKQRLRQARDRGPGGPPRDNDEEPPGIPFDPIDIPAER